MPPLNHPGPSTHHAPPLTPSHGKILVSQSLANSYLPNVAPEGFHQITARVSPMLATANEHCQWTTEDGHGKSQWQAQQGGQSQIDIGSAPLL